MTKFIKLPTHVQEMIEAEVQEITERNRMRQNSPLNRVEVHWIYQLKEAKATAYFREMELIELITEIRKDVENKTKISISELNTKVRDYVSNQGYGSGTNITIESVRWLILNFFLDNQIKNENE